MYNKTRKLADLVFCRPLAKSDLWAEQMVTRTIAQGKPRT
jgi:hypothetical protein